MLWKTLYFGTTVILSRSQVGKGIYPAVDPMRSGGKLMDRHIPEAYANIFLVCYVFAGNDQLVKYAPVKLASFSIEGGYCCRCNSI